MMEPSSQSQPAVTSPQPAKKGFSRALLNFWLDAGLLVAVSVVAWVTVMLHVVFPPPTIADGWKLWGMTYNQWRDIQSAGLGLGGLLALEHLVLHWNWVCNIIATKVFRSKTRPDEAAQAVYGVGTFITIIVLVMSGVTIALFSVQAPPP